MDTNNNDNDKDLDFQKFDGFDSGISSYVSKATSMNSIYKPNEIIIQKSSEQTCHSLPKPDSTVALWRTRFRFLLATVTLLCLTAIWSNIISFNFALLCIEHDHKVAQNLTSITSIIFDSREKIFLTSAVALSALISNFVIVQLIGIYGIRSVYTPLGILAAIVTALFPIALKSGFKHTIMLRVLQGISFAAHFPVIGAFTTRWAYHKQNGAMVSILVSSIQLSPTISDPLSGALCESSLGWEYVFYIHALWTIIIFIIFGFIFRNNPGKHPFVGEHEFRKVSIAKPVQDKKDARKIPYKSILKSKSVWAIWIGSLGNFFCINVLFLYSPNYLHHVLKMNVSSAGAMAAVLAVLQFLVKLSGGTTSDKIKFLSETNKLRLYNSTAYFGAALFFIILIFIPSSLNITCFILLGIAAGFLGLTTGGFFKNGPLLAQQYSHLVTGNISQALMITMIAVPSVIESVAPNNTEAEWRLIFLTIACVFVVTNIIYCIFCSAKPAEWTKTNSNFPSSFNSTNRISNLSFSPSPGKIYPA